MERGVRFLRQASTLVSLLALAVMIVMIMTEVVCRTFLGFSLLISDEMSGYLMVVIVFWGAVLAFDSGSFVRVEALYRLYRGKTKALLDALFLLLMLAYTVVLGWYIWKLSWSSFMLGSSSSSIVQTPLFIPQLMMSLGMLLFVLYLLLKLTQTLLRKGE